MVHHPFCGVLPCLGCVLRCKRHCLLVNDARAFARPEGTRAHRRVRAHLRERGHVRGGGGHSARYGSDDGSDGKRYEGVALFCGDRGAIDAGLPVFYALWREGAPQHVQTGRKDHPERYHPRDL